MTTKRLFNVTIETEIVVLADSKEQAEKIAVRVSKDYLTSYDYYTHASVLTYLPADTTESDCPFADKYTDVDENGKTIGDWLKDGAAPEYMEAFDALKKIGVKKSTEKK